MKKIILGLIILGLIQADTLTETINKALLNNNSLKVSQFQLQKADEENKAVNRRQLPTLTLESSYKYVSDVAKMDVPIAPGQTKEVELGVKDTYDNGLTLSWLAFNGFAKEAQVQLTEYKKRSAELQLAKSQKNIAYQTSVYYINTKLQKLQREVILKGRGRMQLQRDKVKAWVDSGTALPLDLMTITLSLTQYDQQLIAVDSALQSAQEQLNNLVGEKIEVPTASIQEQAPDIQALNISNNEEIGLLKIQKDVTKTNRTLAGANNYPNVVLNASARYGKPGVTPIENEWMNYTTAGIGLQWNVWDWGARSADIAAQENDLQAWQAQDDLLQDQLRFNYDNAAREYRTLQKQLVVLKDSVQVARDKMKILQDQAKNGVVTATDFRDADAELTQYELKLQQQLLNLKLKQIELEYLSGKTIKEWRLD